ncbi:MAG: hypothetical protein KY475_19360 [Planctomycetes bacterium]|nr:hypothetical protein [Planctomycetota bacterium]
MAVKKSSKKFSRTPARRENKARKAPRTPDDIRAYLSRIDQIRGTLAAQVQAMEQLGIEKIEIDGVNKVTRGLDLVAHFALILEHEIKKAQLTSWES